MKVSDEVVEQLLNVSLPYWDGYFMDESCYDEVRKNIKKVLDKLEDT